MPLMFDRSKPEVAAKIMKELCPRVAERQLIVRQLAGSIGVAEGIDSDCWAVTLFSNGFRLNVGSVEAFAFLDGQVRLLLCGSVPREAKALGAVYTCDLKNAPQPSFLYVCDLATFGRLRNRLAATHEAYVRGAAVTREGKPRRTPYVNSHSTGLYTYALQIVGDCP